MNIVKTKGKISKLYYLLTLRQQKGFISCIIAGKVSDYKYRRNEFGFRRRPEKGEEWVHLT